MTNIAHPLYRENAARRDPAKHREYAIRSYHKHAERRRATMRERRAARKAVLDWFKIVVGCADCGYMAHPSALDFDHRPGTVKVMNVGEMRTVSAEVLITEMEKCEVVCANCHRIRTETRRDPVMRHA